MYLSLVDEINEDFEIFILDEMENYCRFWVEWYDLGGRCFVGGKYIVVVIKKGFFFGFLGLGGFLENS